MSVIVVRIHNEIITVAKTIACGKYLDIGNLASFVLFKVLPLATISKNRQAEVAQH